jgi:hypothetical protein
MLRGTPDFLSGVSANDLKQYQQYTGVGMYGPPPTMNGGLSQGGKCVDAFEPSFLDSGLNTEDFFSPFLNPDFPIDISLPMQLGDGVMQSQAPLMQVAQNQSSVRRNPKLVGKRKLQTAAKARQTQQPVQPSQIQQQMASMPQSKAPSMPAAPAPQPTSASSGMGMSMGMNLSSLSARSSPPLSMSQSACYVDSPPSQDQDYYCDGEPDNKRQKRLVKNRQAAQLFRKRQKQYISDLENKVAEVTNKNIALIAKVDVLVTENQLVKDQLKYLRTFVVSALEQAFPPQKYGEMQQQLGDIGLHDAAKKEPTATSAAAPSAAPAATSSSSAVSMEEEK